MKPKFRVWDKLDKEIYEVGEIHWFRGEFDFIGDGITFKRDADEVELMQSTGLLDKNGKEIFEGDIVKCSGLLGTIESFKAMWICSFVKYNNYQKVGFFAQEIEVVGNIYENPELLEVNHDTIR